MEKKKILIIEDEYVIAMHLKGILEKSGYEVLGIASEGKEAIKLFEEAEPNLLLVDINLSGKMTGIDVVRHVNKENYTPIIYLTSSTDKTTLKDVKETKPIAFLKKPFEKEQILSTVDVAMHGFDDSKNRMDDLVTLNKLQETNISELSETNAHLITATWRERELKEELQQIKKVIEKQNEKIMDSINYAHRIQDAIIPKSAYLKELLGEHFVFYKPKDVVSGDFPWVYERDGYVYIAVVDCTGHGVPGAMMSLIGSLLLNDVVNNQGKSKSPDQILNELHQAIVKTLKQDVEGNTAADGMDVAICRIDKKNKEVQFSGAHRPLYHLRKGELTEYKGDKYPIGGNQYKGKNHFTKQDVTIKKGDSIFFFSDGFPDQFGGPENLKYGPKRIREGIIKNGGKSMEHMKEYFENSYDKWKGNLKQIDDVLLIGIKF